MKEEAETVLSELQRSVQRMEELIQEVMMSSGQEKLTEAQEVVNKLESEIKRLKKKDRELKGLVKCHDNIYFLKVQKKREFSGVLSKLKKISVVNEGWQNYRDI